MVPSLNRTPCSARRPLISSNRPCPNSYRSSRWRKWRMVLSSGIGSDNLSPAKRRTDSASYSRACPREGGGPPWRGRSGCSRVGLYAPAALLIASRAVDPAGLENNEAGCAPPDVARAPIPPTSPKILPAGSCASSLDSPNRQRQADRSWRPPDIGLLYLQYATIPICSEIP